MPPSPILVSSFLFFLYYRYIEFHGDRTKPNHPRHEPPAFDVEVPGDDEDHCEKLEAQNRGLLDRLASKVEKQVTETGTGQHFDASAIEMGQPEQ